jgi:hypothetical protein
MSQADVRPPFTPALCLPSGDPYPQAASGWASQTPLHQRLFANRASLRGGNQAHARGASEVLVRSFGLLMQRMAHAQSPLGMPLHGVAVCGRNLAASAGWAMAASMQERGTLKIAATDGARTALSMEGGNCSVAA